MCRTLRPVRNDARLWRARELLGGVVVLAWAGFHLWEQWSAFGGRDAYAERMANTSHGGLTLVFELSAGVFPVIAWVAIEARLRASSEEPADLKSAMAESPELARRLGMIATAGSWVFFAWLIYHSVWLFGPKITEGSEPLRSWLHLREGLGTWPHAVLHALGLTGFAVHVWASFPRLSIVLGWAKTPESRRAARLSGFIVGVGLLILWAQLVGWHAAGAGTVWPL